MCDKDTKMLSFESQAKHAPAGGAAVGIRMETEEEERTAQSKPL